MEKYNAAWITTLSVIVNASFTDISVPLEELKIINLFLDNTTENC